MDWTTLAGMLALYLLGAALAGWVTGWRIARGIGGWRQSVEGRLTAVAAALKRHETEQRSREDRVEQRLEDGNQRFEKMTVVGAVQETIREEFKDFRADCSNRRTEIYGRLGATEKDMSAMKARCDTTHKRDRG